MGSIICSLLRSKMKEQQSNYRVLADPKHILQILFCSEHGESVGTEGKPALAQAQFSMLGSAATFWKHQTTFQWTQTLPRLRRELQRKVLESGRQLSSDHQLRISVTALHCEPPRAQRAGLAREHRSTRAARHSQG